MSNLKTNNIKLYTEEQVKLMIKKRYRINFRTIMGLNMINKYNNTVIQSKGGEHGKRVIEWWKEQGVDLDTYSGCSIGYYYGLIDSVFGYWRTLPANITIIELPESKPKKNVHRVNGFIYITSDEEIKEGDYWIYICPINGLDYGDNNDPIVKNNLPNSWFEKLHDRLNYKKIILTNNQDLIDDGVQSIDDEFLEWFVKNPSCGEVETIYGLFNPMERQVDPMNLGQNHSECVWKYKIIIPKKQSCSCTDKCLGYLNKSCKLLDKYEEEKLYSRKDVLNLLDFVNDRLPDLYSRFNPQEELEEWHKFELKEVSND